MKDENRFSYSRLSVFKQCPRKHHYLYNEKIEAPTNNYALCGKLLHSAIEAVTKGKDPSPVYAEWRRLVNTGEIQWELDQLEYTVSHYFDYHCDRQTEKIIACEYEMKEKLEGDDYFVGVIDNINENDGFITVRDIKSTAKSFKYNIEEVFNSNQLMLYAAFAEDQLHVRVDAVQIDEIRWGKIIPPPMLANGTPTIDLKRLSFTSAELYRVVLDSLGLSGDSKYESVYNDLVDRGNPLFRTTTYHIVDRSIITQSVKDTEDTYHAVKSGTKYKNRSALCRMCAYKDLCELDNFDATDVDRELIITKLQQAAPQDTD